MVSFGRRLIYYLFIYLKLLITDFIVIFNADLIANTNPYFDLQDHVLHGFACLRIQFGGGGDIKRYIVEIIKQ